MTIYGIGIFQPDDDPLIGAFAQWLNPAPYTTTDAGSGGFTLCALWTRIFSPSGIRSWVEVGYTQGFGGQNVTALYWAEGISGVYYEYVVGEPVGPPGTQHAYQAKVVGDEWTVVVDGETWGWSPQPPLGTEINVGGEMTSANNVLTATNPAEMSFQTRNGWQPWTAQPDAISRGQEDPLTFQWIQLGVLGQAASGGAVEVKDAPRVDAGLPEGRPATGPGASGGPFLARSEAEAIARVAAAATGDSQARLVALETTTHGDAVAARRAGRSSTVADDREVYVARFEGTFTFRRGPRGTPPRRASALEVEIDATDGRVLALGSRAIEESGPVAE
ncbi:hypothetical protein [Nannocystis punicea]|uniref:Uncharacterized protein n=1 Tax=Nannocystis punicea TaxID=2995304 RepID=A0ABY7GXN6_9BACT|nr:hypothetical protein [Nannocystis poenicansa]WAS91717.1 hypothetical protein O0S08_36510 [Nannocystis poenicansa]